jgi:hypothetical protein
VRFPPPFTAFQTTAEKRRNPDAILFPELQPTLLLKVAEQLVVNPHCLL